METLVASMLVAAAMLQGAQPRQPFTPEQLWERLLADPPRRIGMMCSGRWPEDTRMSRGQPDHL